MERLGGVMAKVGISFLCKGNDELEYLDNLLKSLHKLSSDVFITLTTNDSDKCKKLIKKYKANWNFFEWTANFSEARQFGFDNLPSEYSHIFYCDCDDIIVNPGVLKKVANNMERQKIDSCLISYITNQDKEHGDAILRVKSLIKRDSGKWVRPIHEVWVQDDPSSFTHDTMLKRIHTKKHEQVANSEQRNLDMLLAIENKTDEDRRYIAASYIYFKKFDKAIKYLKPIKEEFGFYYDVQDLLSGLYAQTDQKDKAIETLKNLANKYPELADPYFSLGKLYIKFKDYNKAVESYVEGFKRKKMQSIIVDSTHDKIINPLGKLAYCYEMTNQHDKAVWCIEVLKKIAPNYKKIQDQYNLIKE